MKERQLTAAPHGHILTNSGVWSPHSRWIVYDVRSDPVGAVFDGTRIERVNVETGEVEILYESRRGACCGVATCSPVDDRVVFIHGPEDPTPEWRYAPHHRRGVIVDAWNPGAAANLDARDLTPPFTPGALRGGTHLHTFSGDGRWVAFTYEDHVLAGKGSGVISRRASRGLPRRIPSAGNDSRPRYSGSDPNQRNVGVSVPVGPMTVKKTHPRNHDGSHFSVLATRTVNQPRPGSDEISRAFEEAWVGADGYLRADGRRQRRALAFQGHVVTERGETICEVFVADLPEDVTVPPEDGPLEGTATRRPLPPRGTVQRRLTHTAGRKHPGLQGPRHWLRSSPDGSRIAFLMKDDAGIVQLWTVSPRGGEPEQVTRSPWGVASAFTWSADGERIACVIDNSVFLVDSASGRSERLTPRASDASAPRPEACVFAPDGGRIAYVRPVASAGGVFNQVFVADL